MGLEKWDLKIWKILRVPFQFSGTPSPLFSEKCASQYILLRFLSFSCFTFCISETFLFFGNFCSIFPFIRVLVLLPSINNPKSINFATLFFNNPLINYVYMCVISISYLNFSLPISNFFDIFYPLIILLFPKLQRPSINFIIKCILYTIKKVLAFTKLTIITKLLVHYKCIYYTHAHNTLQINTLPLRARVFPIL